MDSVIKTSEARIEKVDTKKRFGFWATELTPSLMVIGAFSMALFNHFGTGLRFASLEMTASLGVMRKMARQERNVAISAATMRMAMARVAMPVLMKAVMVGIE